MQTFTQVSSFAHTFVAVASCLVIGYAASWLFPAPAREPGHWRGLTVWDLRD